jgi:hypothetical protein
MPSLMLGTPHPNISKQPNFNINPNSNPNENNNLMRLPNIKLGHGNPHGIHHSGGSSTCRRGATGQPKPWLGGS